MPHVSLPLHRTKRIRSASAVLISGLFFAASSLALFADDSRIPLPPAMISVEGGVLGSDIAIADFLIGIYEVTVAQFRLFVTETGYRSSAESIRGAASFIRSKDDSSVYSTAATDGNWRKPYFPQSDDHPVIGVSFRDAAAFCNWLSAREGMAPFYTGSNYETCNYDADGYRLPSEIEWEYAATAGGKPHKYSGPGGKLTGNVADERFSREFRARQGDIWIGHNDGYAYTAPVGSFAANELGIHDMTGNVHEILNDWYDRRSPADRDDTEQRWGPARGSKKVYRGGCWDSGGFNENLTAIALRHSIEPFMSDNRIGFRVARSVRTAVPAGGERGAPLEGFFLPEDLIRNEVIRFDEDGDRYSISWPTGITDRGFETVTSGDLWRALTGGNTLDDKTTRRAVYADVCYSLAAMPGMNEHRFELFGPVLAGLREIEGVGDSYEKAILAYEVIAYSNLKYVPDAGTLSRLANEAKQAGRFARRTTETSNWSMAKEALFALEIGTTVSSIVKDAVMLNALSTDDVLDRLDDLEMWFERYPVADQELLIAGVHDASERLRKNRDYWYAFADSMKENSGELASLGFATGVKLLSAKVAQTAGVKAAGVVVSLWAVPVAIGISEYREITGVMSSVQRAMVYGYLAYHLHSAYFVAGVSDRSDDDIVRSFVLYGQYAVYEELTRAMSGGLASLAALLWQDIREIGGWYGRRSEQALTELSRGGAPTGASR